MQTNSHFLITSHGFTSPLRVIDTNLSARLHASPNFPQKFTMSEAPQLKRRLTQASEIQKSQNHLVKSIKISYKQNVAPQLEPKHYSGIQQHHQPRQNLLHSVQFQPQILTGSNRLHQNDKRLLRPVTIQPFQLNDPIFDEPIKVSNKEEKIYLKQSDFCKIKQLGKGKFGTVWLVRHKDTNFICAMKIIKKSVVKQEKVEHQVAKELRIHNSLKHMNIIDFYGFFNSEEDFYILTEYATGGQVYSLLKKQFRLSEEEVSPIVKETADGLEFMHNLGFIHRDIKPQNLILQFGTVKICDLGWAAECSANQMRRSICGTPLYYSPEIVRRDEHNGVIDVWSLGILAYELLVGRIPFKIWSQFDLPVILQQQVNFPNYIDLKASSKDFILKCLTKMAALRPSISTLKNHQFFKYKRVDSDLSYEDVRSIL